MPTVVSLLASVLLVLALAVPDACAAERPFAVITAPGVAEHHLTRETLSLIYRRKQKYWENGTRIHPVNLSASNPLRRAFSETILGHTPEELEDYWREMYFHGVLPPHVLESEEAVLLFVRSTPGAIGYVSSCVPDHQVNVALVVGDLPNCPR
jgi:ABC-type phosphate transport system substrate-binding protein